METSVVGQLSDVIIFLGVGTALIVCLYITIDAMFSRDGPTEGGLVILALCVGYLVALALLI